MTLIIVLNALFALGVLLAVVGTLAWAIRTQDRDQLAIATSRAQRRATARPEPTRGRRRSGIAVARATQPSNA
jgi:hypothetical protein